MFTKTIFNFTKLSRFSLVKLSTNKSDPLTDSFGRFHSYLRISLTEKCNLRCVYCMPEEGVNLTPRADLMTLSERKRLIAIFAALGVNKLRFTGGEPTISNQLEELIHFAKSCGIKNIGITTNGLMLKERLDELISAGLSSVNISLDTLSDTKFATITRRDKKNLYRVLSSVYTAVSKGLPVKINCVLMRDFNDSEVAEFIQLTKSVKVDCRFIELMPFDGNEWSPNKFIGYNEVIDRLAYENGIKLIKEPKLGKMPHNSSENNSKNSSVVTINQKDNDSTSSVININSNENKATITSNISSIIDYDPNDTTKWYKAGAEYAGRVGFITSMSSNFCSSCNRLRITADGNLKVCLFGADGLSIRDCMRDGLSDADIITRLSEAVSKKKAVLGGHTSAAEIASHSANNRPMILIGG